MQSKNKRLNFNIILLVLIPIFVIGGSVAKYIYEKNKDIVYQAESFYFQSDLLSDNTNPKAYTYEIGNNSILFNLKNNIDDLRHSEVDIEFSAEITDIQGNPVKNKNGEIVAPKTGKLSKNSISSQKVQFTDLPSGNYLVTAKSLKPYSKTLSAMFLLTEEDKNIEYQVSDALGSPILQVTVITKDYSGNVNLRWSEGVAPDSTNPKFSDVNTGYTRGSTSINFEANSEYTFQFFKKQPSLIYGKDKFIVERGQ